MSESATSPVSTEQNSIAFAEAVKFWLKLGFISFGGPAGQISMMHQEPRSTTAGHLHRLVVSRHCWRAARWLVVCTAVVFHPVFFSLGLS